MKNVFIWMICFALFGCGTSNPSTAPVSEQSTHGSKKWHKERLRMLDQQVKDGVINEAEYENYKAQIDLLHKQWLKTNKI